MRRQLIAFLALLTGLAAIGTPAHASVADALTCEIGVSAHAMDGTAAERTECHHDEAHAPNKGPGDDARPAKRQKRVYRPPVLFGVDRAYE